MIEKKKVIFVISRMSIGGSQKSLVNALNIIDYNKYDVTLYVRENKTELLKDVPDSVHIIVNNDKLKYDHGIYALFLEMLKRVFRILRFKKIADKCEELSNNYFVKARTKYEMKNYAVLKEDYDLAISYLQGYTCKFVADNIKAEKKICFYHNSTNATYELHKEYLPKYDKIITVNENTAHMLEDTYKNLKGKLAVIQNIFNVDEIKNKASAFKISDKEDGFILCSCGRLSKEKGYDIAVEAARKLKDKNVDFKWYFVGDGPERANVEQLIDECGVSDKIVITGFKENPYPWIKYCDIYVQPSYEEAQPLTIIEAKILLTPVISTATVGALGTVRQDIDGMITEINAASLAEDIEKLIKDHDRYELFRKNLLKINLSDYNNECIEKWHNLLEEYT